MKKYFILLLLFIVGIIALSENQIDILNQKIISNDKKEITIMIKNGIDLNKRDSNQRLPLETSLIMENCEIFEYLLKNGADPYLKNSKGNTIYNQIINSNNKTLKSILKKYIQ
ncbi:MAG: hypothetical protein PWP28_309 [Oceanotoga sp.]|jgi:ankyrin repeat protein|uniref:hypothetical protein n=1 Tax=Oceanotoga sp. TaxID=2108366 RepID=UPI0026546B92|nr:hypothetical protein [Oceanotoga sp.]MDN5341434.1 hypothetical protein [Oceanotoga sp.]